MWIWRIGWQIHTLPKIGDILHICIMFGDILQSPVKLWVTTEISVKRYAIISNSLSFTDNSKFNDSQYRICEKNYRIRWKILSVYLVCWNFDKIYHFWKKKIKVVNLLSVRQKIAVRSVIFYRTSVHFDSSLITERSGKNDRCGHFWNCRMFGWESFAVLLAEHTAVQNSAKFFAEFGLII